MAHDSSSRNPIPRWDSAPSGFARYKDEVRVFRLAEKLDQGYSIPARLVSALSGPARRVGLSLKDEELMPRVDMSEPPDRDSGQRRVLDNREANTVGIRIFLTKLELTFQPNKSTERGVIRVQASRSQARHADDGVLGALG